MEFSEILGAAYEDLGYPSSPAADVVTRLKRYTNEGLQHILGEPAIYGLLETPPFTFASVASRQTYTIPDAYALVRGMRDTTNDRRLEPLSLDAYRRIEPDPSSRTGLPTHWVASGRVPVDVQPSDASELFVDSTSASDTNTAYLEGIITGGYKRSASVSMTGVTAVSLSTAITSWIAVTDFYLSAAAVGTVTLHEDASGGTELARITIGQKRPSYLGFALWPTPSGANTYSVDVRQDFAPLVNATDEPPIPRDFHYMLAAYTTYREWQRKDDTRMERALQQFGQAMSRLKYRLSAEDFPVASRGRGLEISRLGAYFPADVVVR